MRLFTIEHVGHGQISAVSDDGVVICGPPAAVLPRLSSLPRRVISSSATQPWSRSVPNTLIPRAKSVRRKWFRLHRA
jgi:hypothetical protein